MLEIHQLFQAFPNDKFSMSIIGMLNGEYIGTLTLTDWDKSAVFVIDFTVKHQRQGQGYGSQLLEYAEKISRDGGKVSISLMCSKKEGNAKPFYVKHGYNTIVHYDSDWLMSKVLNEERERGKAEPQEAGKKAS